MALPDISVLAINGTATEKLFDSTTNSRYDTPVNATNEEGSDEHYLRKLKSYARSLPYSTEPLSKMQDMLDFFIMRIVQCVEAKDYEVGLLQWDSMLTYWMMLKYPIPKEKRIKLAKLYFHLSTTPGMPNQVVATCADAFVTLTKSKKHLTIEDMRLPWRPLYDILKADLFLTRRQFEYTQLSWCMGYIAERARRFFHPAAIEEMLSTFVPQLDGSKLDASLLLSPEYNLVTFLPLSHPQIYLPMVFRLWESINSYKFDNRMLDFLAKLAEIHVAHEISDPRRISDLPDDEKVEDESRPTWGRDELKPGEIWTGIYKDVGIFTDHEWDFIMCKCLASMEIPLADAGSLTTGPSADGQAGFEISNRLPKVTWRISSLARIIVYSMAQDGLPVPDSNAPTPMFSPLPSGMNTPTLHTKGAADFLTAPLARQGHVKPKAYLAGSKALDALARLIASTEHFFHPTNSGAWTNDLSAFIKYVVFEFNKRWHEEQRSDCRTPLHRRLTKSMKRELVKSIRTVCLLAMFSQDSTTVSNIQSCLKSMSIMEPDLVLHPILERAIPSLEALEQTQRTTAVIKALGAIVPAIVSRDVYYPGAKYLLPILQLLLPGIDLNDPSKTLCTTAFLVEVAQHIKFGDLTSTNSSKPAPVDTAPMFATRNHIELPSLNGLESSGIELEPRLSDEEEDALLKDATGSLADWVASFIRRVIQLLENLPDEGPDGSSGGTTEVQVVDSVTGACSQICIHLSDSLFDMVLDMIFDYASTNVRPNAVRAVHQLVECVANARPDKTLAKFFHFCEKNIRFEIENGASNIRTTSSSKPLPSDATLHWNLAILRGTIYNDGKAVLKYKDELLPLLQLLHANAFSKRGFSWTGKLLSSVLLTLTHTYPLENKFVNPSEWGSEELRDNHHQWWGKLYAAEEIEVSWHLPNDAEITFALEVFRELVEPVLAVLEDLIKPGKQRDEIWRNDFCRHLSFVRSAFSGIPTFIKEIITEEQAFEATKSSDILDEIPEMIASIEGLDSGFCLTNPDDTRYQYMMSLKQRFGKFLHDASVSLRQQGEENTVDAVDMLVLAMRTYLLEYGDSRDSYNVNDERYRSEKSVSRRYAKQKIWPRAVLVRRARFYHSARLRWNSLERLRGGLEDALIDDVVEWSLWHYAVIRRSSQSLLNSLCEVYDGVRRRALPVLFKALEPGTDDDRMKGALWTMYSNFLGRYAISEPSLAPTMVKRLLLCQHNEKPSIQDSVSSVFEYCFSSFLEPCLLVYDIESPRVGTMLKQLIAHLPNRNTAAEDAVVAKCRDQRIARIQGTNDAIATTISDTLKIGTGKDTHWRYEIFATRILRTLIRRDAPTAPEHIRFFLDKISDDHPTTRYYAQRALMKCTRSIKLRTFCSNLVDLALMKNCNPLKRRVPVEPSQELTVKLLSGFKEPYVPSREERRPVYLDREPPGWIAWDGALELYLPPKPEESTFTPWESASDPAIKIFREIVTKPSFWKELAGRYSEENHETVVTQDNVSCVKSIFQLLDDEPLEALLPIMKKMIEDKDKNKQRAAAELLAGVIGGSKHWPLAPQKKFWKWFTPYIKQILGSNLKTDTLSIWTSFLEYVFYRTDPRRVQPLVDHLIAEFNAIDYNAEMTFDAVKNLSMFRAFYEELGRKFYPWIDGALKQSWKELTSEHDDVRGYIGELLVFSSRVKWQPRPSIPTVKVFIKECRAVPLGFDIMGMRGFYHKDRVQELVENFKVWRGQRLAGVRAFQSTYDRVGVTVCKWLYQSVHDVHAISSYDYILPLMPELFRFTELNDNNELASRASTLMVRMCGVVPPLPMVNRILDSIFDAIQESPSWRVRLKALPLVQVFYFRQVPLISEIKIVEILEVLCKCLDDDVVEVREMAAATLSGVLRLSPRRSVLTLKDRFTRLARNSHIPQRQSPTYNKAIRQRHAAILGICALIDSYPYTIEKWMPELLTSVLAEHTYDPIPISTTVRKCASNFRKTHQDTWHEDSKKFNEDQLAALSTLLTGSSYYA